VLAARSRGGNVVKRLHGVMGRMEGVARIATAKWIEPTLLGPHPQAQLWCPYLCRAGCRLERMGSRVRLMIQLTRSWAARC